MNAVGDLGRRVAERRSELGRTPPALLTGDSRVIVDPAEAALVQSLTIELWAEGERETYVRLIPRKVTGRRIRRRSDHE
jgi:hypothetical protein